MDQRATFLALILLDALEDENEKDILNVLQTNEAIDPSFVPACRGIAPMHFVCGMDNEKKSLQFTKLFLEMGADPNVCSEENMTPLHVAAIHGRTEIVRLLLQHGAKVDAMDDDRKLPVHYAIEECHFEVVQLMTDFIFLNKHSNTRKWQSKNKTQEEYVQNNSQSITIPSPKKFDNSLRKRLEEKKTSTPSGEISKKVLRLNHENFENSDKYTPNRLHYNYDSTSPYFINITHRRHKPQPKFISPEQGSHIQDHNITTITVDSSPETVSRPLNIFTLTKENVEELSHANHEKDRSRVSLIEIWRNKVKRSQARRSIYREFNDVNEMIEAVVDDDHLNFTNTKLLQKSMDGENRSDSDNDSGAACGTVPASSNEQINLPENQSKKNISLGQLIQSVAHAQLDNFEPVPIQQRASVSPQALPETEASFKTVPEIIVTETEKPIHDSSSFIRSPNASVYYLAMTEAYVHTDDENGLVFYETKLLSNQGNKIALQRCQKNLKKTKQLSTNADTTVTTQSTDITIPLDYETDALRAELTTFGEAPGPITKSTKRLYIKRLIKCKRKTDDELKKPKCTSNKIKFSVELYRSVRSMESFEKITDYLKYETLSTEYFANHKSKHKMREGHLKQSFIYMLIDPRISCNLPGESIYLDKFEIWKRFLNSIFYVGKGKTSRPYSHLYDAMKLHSRLHNAASSEGLQKNGKKISIKKQQLNMELFKRKPPTTSETQHNEKINRILDIWANNRGVVCLHVFHNIMPTEAFTREAAMIDALGLGHLTNKKRGDYYGPAKTWTMKERKLFGIALLFKAMKIYLAEGESQLSPSDLI